MDEQQRGRIDCAHGYVRPGECPTCNPPKLKTLALFSWEAASDGSLFGKGPRKDDPNSEKAFDYSAKVVPSLAVNGGFHAFVILNGSIVHQSEHGSRNDAQNACGAALARAIDLREGP